MIIETKAENDSTKAKFVAVVFSYTNRTKNVEEGWVTHETCKLFEMPIRLFSIEKSWARFISCKVCDE